MTVVQIVKLDQTPFLIGDILVSQLGENQRHIETPTLPSEIREHVMPSDWCRPVIDLKRKVLIPHKHLAMGWADSVIGAGVLIADLTKYLSETKHLSLDILNHAISEVVGSGYGKSIQVELIGWIYDFEKSDCIPFKCSIQDNSVYFEEVVVNRNENIFLLSIGSGAELPVMNISWPKDNEYNSLDDELKAVYRTIGLASIDGWLTSDTTYNGVGGAFEAIRFDTEREKFCYLESVSLILNRWDGKQFRALRLLAQKSGRSNLGISVLDIQKKTRNSYFIDSPHQRRTKNKKRTVRYREHVNLPNFLNTPWVVFVSDNRIPMAYANNIIMNLSDVFRRHAQNRPLDIVSVKQNGVSGFKIKYHEKFLESVREMQALSTRAFEQVEKTKSKS